MAVNAKAISLEQTSSDSSEDDFSDEENTDVSNTIAVDKNTDEFDMDFKSIAVQSQRLKLKPSKTQMKNEKTTPPKPVKKKKEKSKNDEEDDGIAIQSEVLSDYLKPTNILSKYQNGASADNNQNNKEEEEEEKEWPTSKEEIAFNDVTDTFNQNYNEYDAFIDEEKSDFEPIEFEDIYSILSNQAQQAIDDDDIIIEDFREIGWLNYIKVYLLGGCAIALKTSELNEARDCIFKIAKLRFNVESIPHNRMLQTLWMRITDDTRQCDKTGSHWQQIGFQGNDPSTDIRGCGLLGVLQIIFMLEAYPEIIAKTYLLSIDSHQNFPLVLVSFTITGIVLKLLRSCMIYNYINTRQSVMDSINEVYAALFYQFYLDWKNKSRTVIDFDAAQKELNVSAFSNWKGLIQQLARGINEANQQQNINQKKKLAVPDNSDAEEVQFGQVKQGNEKKSATKRQNRYKV